MRIDKFLKLSGLVRRRKVSQEMVKAGKVKRNGMTLKPGSRISKGDIIEIEYRYRRLKIKVKEIEGRQIDYEILEDLRILE